MAKWKCEICGNEFENFHAQGFDNKIYCPLCYFKKENQELKKKLQDMTLCRDIASGHREELQDREVILLTQQKEFIKYLEDEIKRKRLNATCTTTYNDYFIPLKVVLQKYKSIIGGD